MKRLRSSGSRSAFDVMRAGFRRVDQDACEAEVARLRAGDLVDHGLDVTCFLRGRGPGLPGRWRQGVLYVDGRVVVWRPYFGVRRRAIDLGTMELEVTRTRSVDRGDAPPIKPKLYQVVEARSESFRVEFGVPRPDLPLVIEALRSPTAEPKPASQDGAT